jgi:transposase
MRPTGTSEQLAARRRQGLRLLGAGKSTTEIAERLGVTARSVRRWRQEVQCPKPKAQRPPGRPSRLSAKHLQRLEKELKRGAYAHGYAEDYWTLDRVAHLIWQRFAVRYHPSAVWHILRRMGWSCQRPQRRPFGQDDQAVAHWRRYLWPQIKKVAGPARDAGHRR